MYLIVSLYVSNETDGNMNIYVVFFWSPAPTLTKVSEGAMCLLALARILSPLVQQLDEVSGARDDHILALHKVFCNPLGGLLALLDKHLSHGRILCLANINKSLHPLLIFVFVVVRTGAMSRLERMEIILEIQKVGYVVRQILGRCILGGKLTYFH